MSLCKQEVTFFFIVKSCGNSHKGITRSAKQFKNKNRVAACIQFFFVELRRSHGKFKRLNLCGQQEYSGTKNCVRALCNYGRSNQVNRRTSEVEQFFSFFVFAKCCYILRVSRKE